MTSNTHTTDKFSNGTVRHTYTSGPLTMIVLDRSDSRNDDPSHVTIHANKKSPVVAEAMPGLDPDEPDYLIETQVRPNRRDLDNIIEGTITARDTLAAFREILRTNHQITTTLNGQ